MKIDFEKVGVIASYFAENTKNLYVTKLLKLFYYLDFVSYKTRGMSVTNDLYFKFPYGPVPSSIKNNIDLLSKENILGFGDEFKSQLTDYIKLEKKDKGTLVINKAKDINLRKLSNSDLELVKCVAATFKNTNSSTLSNQTHKETPWMSTSDFSVIDYSLAESLDVSKVLPTFSVK